MTAATQDPRGRTDPAAGIDPAAGTDPTAGIDRPGRMAWADAAKGLLIVLVVFWHVVMKTYLQIDWRIGPPIPGMWGLISDLTFPIRMPLFFVISGLLAANAVARPWAAVFRSRVVRFLYLYLLWSLIHMALMWAFPEFPTLVPHSVAEFIEAVTISPPNTWYLYALALYFLVAKSLRRLPPWLTLGAAAALSIAVAAGLVDVVSNRGSLLSNLVFFLLGVCFAPQLVRFAARARPLVALGGAAAYVLLFWAMRAAGAEAVPGVWLIVSLVGVGMGVAFAPLLANAGRLGRVLQRLGGKTLVIYVIHMPVLALADALVVGWVSDARIAVQLLASVVLPIVLTGIVIVVSVWLGDMLKRDGFGWLFDLPRRRAQPPTRGKARRIPFRAPAAVALLVALGVTATAATAIPARPTDVPRQAAERPGEVSVGAVGDVLLYSAEHTTPADLGRGHFDGVRSWFTEDLVTGNLEQAISAETGLDKCAGLADCLAFRSDPDAAGSLAGFDILNLANNHSRDFGQAGYDSTRQLLAAAGVRTVGDRDEISYTRVGDTTVAMVGFAAYSEFNRVTDLRHVSKIVRAAAAQADIVIVQAHMGAEGRGADVVVPGRETMYGENRGDPVAFSRAAVDAGADLVLGHGPHILRGMEFYRGKLIAYSLGNFGGGGVFGRDEATRFGAYLSVRLSPDGELLEGRVRSLRFDYPGGVPEPDPEHGAAALMDERGARDFGDAAARLSDDGAIILPAPPAAAVPISGSTMHW